MTPQVHARRIRQAVLARGKRSAATRTRRVWRSSVLILGFLALGAFVTGMSPAANADILQISATSFALRCPCANTPPSNDEFGEESQGLLLNAHGTYFAAAPFPSDGLNVCRFSLLYRDNDADINVRARLKKKRVTIGGNAFDPPVVMATVSSSGAANGVRRATTTDIRQPSLTLGQAFYYVELVIPGNTLEVLGAQIDARPVCPPV